MEDAKRFDEAIATTVALRQSIEYLRRANLVERWELPFSIEGTDDPFWVNYKEHERERRTRIQKAQDLIEENRLKLRDIERSLLNVIPYGVWVLHEYQGRLFGIGLAYQRRGHKINFALRIELINHEKDLHKYPPLKFDKPHMRLVSEWESVNTLVWEMTR